jgi:hypothetical protein
MACTSSTFLAAPAQLDNVVSLFFHHSQMLAAYYAVIMPNYALCHGDPNMPKFMLAQSAQA